MKNNILCLLICSASIPLLCSPAYSQLKKKQSQTAPKKLDAEISQGKAAVENSDCLSCHRPTIKLIGPSFRSISQKYKPTDENIQLLIGKILLGGSGTWGEVPMSPHKDLKEAEVKKMVNYILSIK